MLCVADTWYTNGSVLVPNTGLEGLISGTYQPVWDAWQRFIQPLVSNVSALPAPLSYPHLFYLLLQSDCSFEPFLFTCYSELTTSLFLDTPFLKLLCLPREPTVCPSVIPLSVLLATLN